MIDANSQFFAILTNVGMAKQANADALGIPWKITDMGVGDANDTDPIPNAAQTRLISEWRRRPLNQLRVDPVNPAVIIAEQIIPADEGGHWIREIGLYDADGDLVAVANCAPSFKPVLSQGSGRTQVVRMNFIVSSTGNITLKIDPAVVLATREYVDQRIMEELYKLDSKQSVRVATTANIALAGLQAIDGIALAAGDRVLVKSQTVAKDNGLYVAAAGAWARAADADASSKVTSALIVSVEQGTTLADTRWQLVTDGAIVLGSTALVFQNITQGFAPINSPALLGTPTCPTPPQFDTSDLLVNAEFVQRALGSMRGSIGLVVSKDLTVADVGKRIELAPGVSITLPLTSTVPNGAALLISTQAAATAHVGVFAGDVLSMCNIPVATPRQLAANSDFLVIREGNVWRAHLGTETLRTSSLFAASLTPNGRQANPSGLLFQWVTGNSDANGTLNLTLPVTFPNEILGGLAGEANPGGWGATSATVWGFHHGASTTSRAVAQVRVIAGTAGPSPAVATGRILVWGR
ncbi:phage tail protein [Pseudomonas chlororaphis]|uniref:phage tail protein n=1 Tax=Pseudomonas chlororaphis TaxID=587753 RepID=UPI0009B8E4B5|nr:phage tail protein [Pseudomonas chlororaphis]